MKEYQKMFDQKGKKYADDVYPLLKLVIRAFGEYGARKVRQEIYEEVNHAR